MHDEETKELVTYLRAHTYGYVMGILHLAAYTKKLENIPPLGDLFPGVDGGNADAYFFDLLYDFSKDDNGLPTKDPHEARIDLLCCVLERLCEEVGNGQTYQDYLKTKHWKKTRKEAIARAKHRCQICNSPDNLHVHHRTYERLGKENPEDLTVLCYTCHSKAHNKLSSIP